MCLRFGGVVPEALASVVDAQAAEPVSEAVTAARASLKQLNEDVKELVGQYIATMENIKLRDGIKIAMAVSGRANKFLQVRSSNCIFDITSCMISPLMFCSAEEPFFKLMNSAADTIGLRVLRVLRLRIMASCSCWNQREGLIAGPQALGAIEGGRG